MKLIWFRPLWQLMRIPTEYKGRSQEYLDLIIEQMLPKVKEEKLAEFCDIFCEKGVFTADESRYLLSKSQGNGLQNCGFMRMKSSLSVVWMLQLNWNLLAQNT